MNEPRTKRTIEIWDRCECGKTLHSIAEGQRGVCGPCWVKAMPRDTKEALDRLIASAFKPTSEADRGRLVDDAMAKLDRDRLLVPPQG